MPEMTENVIESGYLFPVERLLGFRDCVELSLEKAKADSFSIIISVGEGDESWDQLPDKVRETVFRANPEDYNPDKIAKKKKNKEPKAKAKSAGVPKSTSGKASGKASGYSYDAQFAQWEQWQAYMDWYQKSTYMQWSATIREQVEFYFSEANLASDNYLKQQMNEDGWVPAVIIGSFNRVRTLGVPAEELCNHLQDSKKVEVDEGKKRIRRRR